MYLCIVCLFVCFFFFFFLRCAQNPTQTPSPVNNPTQTPSPGVDPTPTPFNPNPNPTFATLPPVSIDLLVDSFRDHQWLTNLGLFVCLCNRVRRSLQRVHHRTELLSQLNIFFVFVFVFFFLRISRFIVFLLCCSAHRVFNNIAMPVRFVIALVCRLSLIYLCNSVTFFFFFVVVSRIQFDVSMHDGGRDQREDVRRYDGRSMSWQTELSQRTQLQGRSDTCLRVLWRCVCLHFCDCCFSLLFFDWFVASGEVTSAKCTGGSGGSTSYSNSLTPHMFGVIIALFVYVLYI